MNPQCAEASAVAVDHDVKGQGLYAFVVLVDGVTPSDALKKEIMDCVRREVFSTLIK
jgi:acetyl-CoA synthetase